jgi:hypothetical protein
MLLEGRIDQLADALGSIRAKLRLALQEIVNFLD